MDLKDWKKTKEDKLGVEMMHPKGHKMTILFKGVPLVQRESLKRLPLHDGGDVKGVHKSAVDVDKPASKKEKSMAGESKAGEHLRNSDIRSSSKDKAKDEHNKVLGEMKSMPQPKLKGLASGGMAHYADGAQPVSQDDTSQPAPALQTTQPAPGATSDQALSGAYNQTGNLLNKIQATNAANRMAIEKSHAAWDAYNANPENKIDADQYRKNMNLPAKAATAVGLFLGGFSVPFGGQNYTQSFLNDQITRNVEAQKENYQHQKNVWGAAHDLFGDEQVANNFAKTVALDQTNNLVRQSALSIGTPKAAARAEALINQNNAQKEQLKNQSANQLTNKQMAENQPLWQRIGNFINGVPTDAPSAASAQEFPNQQQNQKEEVPNVPIPQFQVDEPGIKRSQYLGAEGNIPNQINPGEVGSANDELGKAHQFNDKIKLIHQNFADLWKNRSDANQALKYFSSLGVNLEGIHLQPPDLTTWSEPSKNYFRAANRIKQELATLVGNGALTHEQAESVLTNLIKQDDTPDDYKNVLNQVDENIMSAIKTPVLEKYGKIKRPKIAD